MLCWMLADALQNIDQVGIRVDALELAGYQQTLDHAHPLRAAFGKCCGPDYVAESSEGRSGHELPAEPAEPAEPSRRPGPIPRPRSAPPQRKAPTPLDHAPTPRMPFRHSAAGPSRLRPAFTANGKTCSAQLPAQRRTSPGSERWPRNP